MIRPQFTMLASAAAALWFMAGAPAGEAEYNWCYKGSAALKRLYEWRKSHFNLSPPRDALTHEASLLCGYTNETPREMAVPCRSGSAPHRAGLCCKAVTKWIPIVPLYLIEYDAASSLKSTPPSIRDALRKQCYCMQTLNIHLHEALRDRGVKTIDIGASAFVLPDWADRRNRTLLVDLTGFLGQAELRLKKGWCWPIIHAGVFDPHGCRSTTTNELAPHKRPAPSTLMRPERFGIPIELSDDAGVCSFYVFAMDDLLTPHHILISHVMVLPPVATTLLRAMPTVTSKSFQAWLGDVGLHVSSVLDVVTWGMAETWALAPNAEGPDLAKAQNLDEIINTQKAKLQQTYLDLASAFGISPTHVYDPSKATRADQGNLTDRPIIPKHPAPNEAEDPESLSQPRTPSTRPGSFLSQDPVPHEGKILPRTIAEVENSSISGLQSRVNSVDEEKRPIKSTVTTEEPLLCIAFVLDKDSKVIPNPNRTKAQRKLDRQGHRKLYGKEGNGVRPVL